MAEELGPFEALVFRLREHVALLDGAASLRWLNAPLAEVLGRGAGDVGDRGLAPMRWLSSESVPPLMRAMAAIGTGFSPPGERITIQLEFRGPDCRCPCVASLQGLGDSGRVALIARPVAAREDTGLLASQADFLANLSHELRTPLLAILGNSELLVRTGSGAWTEAQRGYARDALDSGRNLLRQIEDVLEFAKVRAGRMTLQLAPAPLDSLLRGCLQTGRALALERDLEISAALEGDLGVIHTDERLLRHAVLNLLSNAIKFTPDGGKVELAARRKGPWAQIAVRDTGIGVDSDEAGRIFGAFYQVDSGVGRRARGTGLGLAIVTRFVELLGGGIRMHSRPGVGSTFTLHVPTDSRRSADVGQEPSESPFDLSSLVAFDLGEPPR